jgi:hypothetical protein
MNYAIGLRVKTGAAVAILVARNGNSFEAIDRQFIVLCDSDIPNTRQPYHVIEEISDSAKAEKEIARLCKIVRNISNKELRKMMKRYEKHKLSKAALVVGSMIDPAKIGNPHVRAHASEGKLFRTVVEEALTSAKFTTRIFQERDLFQIASKEMRKTESELKTLARNAAHNLTGPWRMDEKAAFVAACLLLHRDV